MKACANGSLQIAQSLVKAGALTEKVNDDDDTCLIRASYWMHQNLVEWLLTREEVKA